MRQNIILTGCAGFIGFHTTLKALQEGWDVFGIDDLLSPHSIFTQRLSILKQFPQFKFFKINLNSPQDLLSVFKNIPTQICQRVFHFAGLTGVRDSVQNPLLYLRNNIESTYHLISTMQQFKLKHLTFASTSSVYNNSPIPYQESQTLGNPCSPYAVSKKSCEDLLYSYFNLFDFNITILRFFTIYGPFGRPDMSIYSFIEKVLNQEPISIFGTGNQKRDFTYIEDLIPLIFQTLEWKGFDIINTAIGNSHSLLDMIHFIFKHTKLKTPLNFLDSKKEDMLQTISDPTKMKQKFILPNPTSLDEGIEKTIQWHLKQRNS